MKTITISMLMLWLLISACTSTKNGFVLEKTTETMYKVHNGITMQSVEKIYNDPTPKSDAFMREQTTEYTTPSGKKFLVHERSDNLSLVNVTIKAQGFSRHNNDTHALGEIEPIKQVAGKRDNNDTHALGSRAAAAIITQFSRHNNDTHALGEIDPIVDIWHSDLNADGYSEWFITTRGGGSGAYGHLFGYVSDADIRLVYVEIPKLTERETRRYTYRGHDKFYRTGAHANSLIREFPLYNKHDPNADPTGGRAKIYYALMEQNSKFVLTPIKVLYRKHATWQTIKQSESDRAVSEQRNRTLDECTTATQHRQTMIDTQPAQQQQSVTKP